MFKDSLTFLLCLSCKSEKCGATLSFPFPKPSMMNTAGSRTSPTGISAAATSPISWAPPSPSAAPRALSWSKGRGPSSASTPATLAGMTASQCAEVTHFLSSGDKREKAALRLISFFPVSSVWWGIDRVLRYHPVPWLAAELLKGARLRVADPQQRREAHRTGRPNVSVAHSRHSTLKLSFLIWSKIAIMPFQYLSSLADPIQSVDFSWKRQ